MIEEFLKKHSEYYDDKSFKDLTTLKMGGHIKHYCLPNTIDDLKEIINYLKYNKIPFKVIGNGSNLVCGSSEFDGVIINLSKLDNYEFNNEEIYVEAGVKAMYLSQQLAKLSLSGLEFASGIPGNIGGLVYMNAGAYKKSMADVVTSVLVLKDNELVWLNSDELNFKYRHSIFGDHPHWVIVAAKLKLQKKDSQEILELMADRLERRKNSQPLDKCSAGSCFRNPDNGYAWELIDGIGYRGYKIGDVMVSEKHSNFIINNGEGTGEDYMNIAYEIMDKVKAKYGIKLVLEVEKFNC